MQPRLSRVLCWSGRYGGGFAFCLLSVTIAAFLHDGPCAHFLFSGLDRRMDLRNLLETTLTGLGYELVDLELARGGMVRVFMDSPQGITVDDCVKVSNHLTRLFMVENVDYERLEVSSPGLDRPLTRESDFSRFAGQHVRLRLRLPLEGARRVSGILRGLASDVVQVEQESGAVVEVPLSNIDKARLDPRF